MRATLISMIAVALMAAGVCAFSVMTIGRAADEMDGMRIEVLEMVGAGDAGGAHERLRQMAEKWRREEALLAVLAPHEALHGITELIIEGGANLEAEDLDDFNRSMELLGEALNHLYEEERLHLSNIL